MMTDGTPRRASFPGGMAALELALSLPFLLLLVLGASEYALQFHVRHRMTYAAREAARCLAVRDGTIAQATAVALSELSPVDGNFVVTASLPAANDPNQGVSVRISIPRKDFSFGLLGLSSDGSLQVQVIMRKEGT